MESGVLSEKAAKFEKYCKAGDEMKTSTDTLVVSE